MIFKLSTKEITVRLSWKWKEMIFKRKKGLMNIEELK